MIVSCNPNTKQKLNTTDNGSIGIGIESFGEKNHKDRGEESNNNGKNDGWVGGGGAQYR